MKKNKKIIIKEVDTTLLQERLIALKRKLFKSIEKTKISDEKVYKYSLEIEYVLSLLNSQKKIQA